MWGAGFNGNDSMSMTGGFLQTTTNFDSPASKKPGAVRRHQSVVPVVLRMLIDCKEEEFKMYGLPVQMVSVVGIVTKFQLQSTKANYLIEDHTGSINALWWLESDGEENTTQLPPIKEGTYVKVYGTIKTQDGAKALMVLKMFPVEDCNILTTHLLEVINCRLQSEALSNESAVQIKKNNPGASLANSIAMMDENVVNNGMVAMSEIQKQVFRFLQINNSATGPDKKSILEQFPINRRREASEALDFLVNEGHAYSTIDNEHFKVTEG